MADRALARLSGIRDYDLVQKEQDRYVLLLKGTFNGHETVVKQDAKDLLSGLYGPDGRFRVEIVNDLLPGPAGKYRRTHAAFDYDDWSLCGTVPLHTI
jgi:hypothetical protein